MTRLLLLVPTQFWVHVELLLISNENPHSTNKLPSRPPGFSEPAQDYVNTYWLSVLSSN